MIYKDIEFYTSYSSKRPDSQKFHAYSNSTPRFLLVGPSWQDVTSKAHKAIDYYLSIKND